MLDNIGFWLQNIQQQIPAVMQLIVAISYVTGILFVSLGVFKLKAYGQMTIYQTANASMSGPLIFFIIGIFLLALPQTIDVLIYTIWGYGTEDVPSYAATGTAWDSMIAPVLMVIQAIGLISFFRGWVILSKTGTSGAQPGTLSKGMTHILGGILAINVMGTWEIIRNTVTGIT